MNLKKLMETRDSFGLLAMRLVTGAIYLGHGLPKIGWTGDGTMASLAERWSSNPLIPLPQITAYIWAPVETIGGALIMAGLFTRVLSALHAIGMFVAVYAVHWSNGFLGRGGYQYALLLLVCSVCLMLEGAGKWSVDRKISS